MTATPATVTSSAGTPAAVSPLEIAPGVVLGGDGPLPVVSGPCVLESEELAICMADFLAAMAARLGVAMVFKSSYDKANRSDDESFRGPGLERGLAILAEVKASTGLPILTDVHEPWHCARAATVADVLQITAFLCRQTDLLHAAADTGRAVNVKRGQFMAPDDLPRAVDKVRRRGNDRVFVTERGVSFGYHDLVVDMRSFDVLHDAGVPVVFDVTHALQRPGGGKETGGVRRHAETLARAAVAAGADGVFLEVHPDPEHALSDRTTQLSPDRAEALLRQVVAVRAAVAGAVGAGAAGASW